MTPLFYRRLAQCLLLFVSLAYLLVCPYSKVEESFQLQAVHDIFYHGTKLELYDHLRYPGVVPRTFTGPALIATICQGLRLLLYPIVDLAEDPETVQLLSRLVLLLFFLHALNGLAAALPQSVGTYLILITACQFHLPFYASRMLPNVFSTILVLHACRYWTQQRVSTAAIILVFTMTVIRCDVLLLVFSAGLSWLICRQLGILQAISIGIKTVLVSLALTVPMDSWFWQQWLWPEGNVLYFNTVLNKSSDYGVSPWYWYLIAIPKAMLLTGLFMPLSVFKPAPLRMDTTWFPYLLPAALFVGLYSCLGHKEMRFLFPILPLLNLASAAGLARIHQWQDGKKQDDVSILSRLVYIVCMISLVLSLIVSMVFVAVSHSNYPGGVALDQLVKHAVTTNQTSLKVHVDVAAAMTGISLFGQRAAQTKIGIEFDKAGYEYETNDLQQFSHILSETIHDNFHVISTVQGFPRLDFRQGRIATRDAIHVLQRNDDRAALN
jgi:alpha-1,6-mannosyltransferase